LIGILISLIGIALGLKGRRLGEHPHCRRCEFDLFGKPEDSTQCAECGTDLSIRGAIVTGVRRKRIGLLLTSGALLLTSCGLGVPMGYEIYQSADWQRMKPDWWLASQFDPTINPVPSRVLTFGYSAELELSNRMRTDLVMPGQGVSDRAIRIMSRRVSNCIKAGKPVGDWPSHILRRTPNVWISDDSFHTLIRAAVHSNFRIDSEVVYGDPISYTGRIGWPYGNDSADKINIAVKVISDRVNGINIGQDQFRTVESRMGPVIMEMRYLDLKSLWSKIGYSTDTQPVQLDWQREIKITIELKNGNETYVERWIEPVSATATVLDARHSMAATQPSNQFDRAIMWSATLHVAGDEAWIGLQTEGDAGNVSTHVVNAHVVLIGNDREVDTGICWGSTRTQGFRASDVPTGSLRVELRPAPEMRWMFIPNGPILGEVIHIENVERVNDSDDEVVRFNLSMF